VSKQPVSHLAERNQKQVPQQGVRITAVRAVNLLRGVSPAPTFSSIVVVDDQTTADAAFRLARDGKGLLWRGDFHNARQLLQAMARRVDRQRPAKLPQPTSIRETFNQYRATQGQRAAILNRLLIPFEADYHIPLRRAPDVRQACSEACWRAKIIQTDRV
jgi:hypothetical protein